MYYGHHMGYFPGGYGWFSLIIIVIVIGILAYLINQLLLKKDRSGSTSSAMEILKMRYAKGEISKEEFLEKKRFIQSEGADDV